MKVSVAMITYNHEEFIAKAIDSVMMQRTNFDYEIVIGEDCSTDNTRNIVSDYQKKYPDKFRLLLNEKNIGANRNAEQTFGSCTGEYVAVLDGDDYWTSPYKLQKQVDFLDNHPECVICFHNVLMFYKDGSHECHVYCPPGQKEFSTVEDLLEKGNIIPTCSKMYRRGLLDHVPHWICSLKMGDWPVDILHALYGKIGYINEIMGVYVIHQTGMWFGIRQNWEEKNKANIEVYEKFYDLLESKYKRIIKRILHERHVDVAEQYEDMGKLTKAKEFAVRSVTKYFVMSTRSFKLLLRLYVPALYKLLKSLKLEPMTWE
ncbi:glycosyltransferase [Geotalea uraniireducens]|uniref:Glycosyl transferase, family 2 n=1 Tax=Geotalea uraniireducens (strain Rf4) TaxID=351605 RepID=A5G409_GEOUR|nr:glycosyltransferase [Geotalea uraniireducens]ABQ26527.1 glycosyl transferase, family 2 [Geotalea uraniireducens Rf4]